MPVDRPTFSESWYRVAQLRPRLRSTVHVYRQHFRGRMWYVLQDPSNNQFFRQNESAYHFVALLDGQRTVAEVWEACNEQLGDSAPTQGEAIQLLGQLYTSNLIRCELPPDAQGLFDRYRKRVQREVKGYLSNLLFIRVPLLDPDRFLDRWVKVFGQFFTVYGMVLWIAIILTGLYFVINNFGALWDRGESVLDPDNLPLLYLSFAFIKGVHEFGHAFACKKFGQLAGGGEVHVMGIMFLVFTPLPYVDASSAYAFRNKWHRVTVDFAGILVELAIAGIAAVVWAKTGDGAVHTIAYNMMFVASVSTLLFNANPLLRYDGYYILADLVEIPNLYQRAKQYLYYLVKRYAWSVRNPRNPAHTNGERGWFVFYGIASTCYRFFIYGRILLFVANKLFILGAVLGIVAAITWILVPLGKFVHYLATSGELMRTRGRAVLSTLAVVAAVVVGVGLVPRPDRFRVEGVVEPRRMAVIFAEIDGRVRGFIPSGELVSADTKGLIQAENPDLQTELARLLAERRSVDVLLREARADDPARYKVLGERGAALDEKIQQVREDLEALSLPAEMAGTWVAPGVDLLEGAYVGRGERIGLVVDLDDLIIRSTATQQAAALLIAEATRANVLTAEIRVKGCPDIFLTGSAKLKDILPAGKNQLPSAALGYSAGGSMRTVAGDPYGMRTAEKFFEIVVQPDIDTAANPPVVLLTGQRVVVRFNLPPKPLIAQWWRALLQLIQRRFHI